MGDDSREAMLAAVNELTSSPAAKTLFDTLTSIIRVARLHPVKLDGDAAVLNPLLSLALNDPAAYEWVIVLIDNRRVTAGLEALRPPEEKKFDKVAYQRDFMDHKRQRQRRAVEIENMARPPRDQLIGRARLDFMDGQAAKWKTRLDDLLDAARRERGSRLPREVMEQLRTQFWAGVDAELDALEAEAKRPKK